MDPSLAATLVLAFGLGLLHALDADHVMAVSALASRRPSLRQAIGFCARWALGHAMALLLLGVVVLWLGARLPGAVVDWAEELVGVVLIVLGVSVLWDLRRRRIHVHAHAHDGLRRHAHWHAHQGNAGHGDSEHRHEHGAVLVGLLHGTAGSAPVIALVPLARMESPWLGCAYLVLFSGGVLVSMILFGALIGYFFDRLARLGPGLLNGTRAVVALASIGFGAFLL